MIVSKKMHEFDKNYGIMKSHIRVKDMIFFISLRVFYKKITLILFLTVDFYKFLAIIGKYYELKFVCRDVDCKSFKFITDYVLHNTIVLIELCKNTDYYKVYLNQIISKVQ